MIERETKDITEEVLRKLILEKVSEGKTLEFKRILEINDPKGKLKFLRGIASFANASGGDIIFGLVADKEGKAESLMPLDGLNPDQDVLRLRDIIRMNIDPRTIFAEFQPVELSEGGYALVIRIRKSWSGAHFVTHEGDFKFYTRDHGGRRLMEVPEIRNSFTLSESISDKINRFRLERLGKIMAGETPHPLVKGATIVIHICPLRSFEAGFQCDLSLLRNSTNLPSPLNSSAYSRSNDFDGFCTYSPNSKTTASSYNFVFRNGCLEATETTMLSAQNQHGFSYIPGVLYEKEILDRIPKWTELLKSLGIEAPALVMLSLLGVKGYVMGFSPGFGLNGSKINRNELIASPIFLETFDVESTGRTTATNVIDLMRPTFDTIWNACGYSHSSNFDKDGNWKPRNC